MKRLFAIVPFLVLVACGSDLTGPSDPVGPRVPAPAQDTCNANQYAQLIGQDVTALERVLLMGQVRVIRPGQAVTMDFRPERINFNVASDDTIASITCS